MIEKNTQKKMMEKLFVQKQNSKIKPPPLNKNILRRYLLDGENSAINSNLLDGENSKIYSNSVQTFIDNPLKDSTNFPYQDQNQGM
jgi:hypothetical protein